MKLKLTDNLGLKLLALFSAVVLWLVVVNINDSIESVRYTLGVDLRNTNVITDNGKVFRVEDGTDTVRVTVRARRSVVSKLDPTDFTLVADMEKDLKYDSLVGITVECKNKHINPEEDVTLSRTNVKVSIEDSATEHFPVKVRAVGNTNSGLEIGSMTPERTIIKISGPVSIIERIQRVEAEVDVTGIPSSTVKNCKLKILDGNGEEMDTTYLNYAGKKDGIDVTVTMLNTKTLPIKCSYEGAAAEGYRITGVTCKPDVVTVAGNAGVLAGLSFFDIPAEAVNVDGISSNLQQVVDLEPYLPEGVIFADENDTSVVVTVTVEYIEPAVENPEDGEDAETDQPSAGGSSENSGGGGASENSGHSEEGDSSGNKEPESGGSADKKPSDNQNEQQKPDKPEDR